MTEQEIIKRISKIEGLAGMTVNERLFVCRLVGTYANEIMDWWSGQQ